MKLGVFPSKYNSLVSPGPGNCPMSDLVWNILVLYSLVQWWIIFSFFYTSRNDNDWKKSWTFWHKALLIQFFSLVLFLFLFGRLKCVFYQKFYCHSAIIIWLQFTKGKKRGNIIIQFNIPSVWWENGQKITQTHPMSLRIVYIFFSSFGRSRGTSHCMKIGSSHKTKTQKSKRDFRFRIRSKWRGKKRHRGCIKKKMFNMNDGRIKMVKKSFILSVTMIHTYAWRLWFQTHWLVRAFVRDNQFRFTLSVQLRFLSD